jgi:L-rhamnonate dehydratase
VKIASITCDYIIVPVEIPVRGTTREFGVLLVTVETDEGITGIGLGRHYDSFGRSVKAVILNDIAPFLKEKGDLMVPGRLWHEAAFEMPWSDYRSPTGVVAAAMGAVDQALWDIRGKATGEPVYRLLGGAQPEIEVYLTFGLSVYTPEEETEATKRYLAQGFKTFKLQGIDDRGRDIAKAAARVRRLRENVGEENGIILDGHNNYAVYEAIALAKAVEPYRMTFFDEPTFSRDPAALKQLHEALPGVAIAGRSRGGSLLDNRDLVMSGALQVIGSNVLDQGGYTQGIKVAHLAEMYHLPMVTGGAWHLQNAHLIAAATNGWMTEYHTLAAALSETIFVDPIKPVNSRLTLSDKPGLGLELDRAAVDEAIARARAAENASE